MPEQSGPFERQEVVRFDHEGRDLAARYDAVVEGLPVVATVYVYPAASGQPLDAQFDQASSEIGASHGGASAEFREHVTLDGRFDARYSGFGYAEPWAGVERDVPLRSYLLLYRDRDWWVKWRVTTPAPIDEARMAAIVKLTRSVLPGAAG